MENRITRVLSATLATILLSSAASAAEISFYENNSCRGRPAFTYYGEASVRESCKTNGARCRNDVARSVRVTNWNRTLSIFVYDDPNGRSTDDEGAAHLRDNPKYVAGNSQCFESFERDINDWRRSPEIIQFYRRNNGLDGKVSYIYIRY